MLTVTSSGENGENETRESAAEYVAEALRDLAANILRVIGGAGEPHKILWLCGQYAALMEEYEKRFGGFPAAGHHAAALRLATPGSDATERAENDVIRFAVRAAAADLVGGKSARAQAARSMHNAMIMWRQACFAEAGK